MTRAVAAEIPGDPYFAIADVARHLSVSPATVRREMRCIRVASKWVVSASEIVRYVAERERIGAATVGPRALTIVRTARLSPNHSPLKKTAERL